MATKLQIMTELAANRALEITDGSDNWMNFLETASWNYKYKYQEQLLIYSQKPNATACAPIDTWNSLGRYVNRGAKGIALLVEGANEFKLRYVFDVSDTNTRYERPIYIWKMKDNFKDSVLETLENSFGELSNKYDFAMSLIETAKNAVEDNYADYLSSLIYVRKDSFLEEVDEFNVDTTFKKLLYNSVSYMMLNRCDINAKEYLNSSDFKKIGYFNTIETVGVLGDATSDISEMTLKEIGETVKNLQKAEKNKIRTFAEKQKDHYYDDRNKTEGSFENGSNLYNAGRLSNSGIRSTQTTEDWKVWNVTSNISKETQKRDLCRNDDVGQVEQPLRGDRPISINPNEIDNFTDGTATGCDRETQSNKSDEMGGDDEQHKASGRGNSSKTADLQLELLLSEEQQIEIIDKAEVYKTSVFLPPKDNLSGFSQEDIDAVLQRGSGVEHGKYRIYLWYQKNKSQSENSEFLKNEYGIGGAYPAVIDTDLDEGHDGKGIKISRGKLTKPDGQMLLSWTKVAKRIGELIAADQYLNSKEKQELSSYIEWENERSIGFEEEKLAKEILSSEQEAVTIVPKEYKFSLGDTVYLGASEYEILSYNDKTVRLYDCSFPIINKEINRSEFDQRIKENSLNDHLLHEVDSVVEESIPEENKNEINEVLEEINQFLLPNLIGENIKIDGREFIVDAVDMELNKVSLKDITFQNGVGFPIFRSESVEFVNDLLRKKEEQITSPPKQKMEKVQTYDLHPDIPQSDRHNFRTTNENLENDQTVFSPKQKFIGNIGAIKLLKKLESENRFATPEEQETLARYIGFGGLADAFDDNKSSWANEYMQLKTLLNEDEYLAARESTLTAFYTSPIIIKSMYKALENMGFQTGNILEPSCGTGNFLGMLPDSMQNSKLYGIELDSITGRVAQQLYQKSNIVVQGFEKTNLPDSFFDVAIGNVPFGQFKVADKRYDKNNFLIHDYFFGKTLDKVRPGGVIAFITSKGTMDKENSTVRKYIAKRADLLGAIRLPNTAFKANAGTEVTSDIIFLQKRDRIIDIEPDWVHLNTNENGIKMNSYFVKNPEMILGEMVMESTQYGLDSTCKPYENQDLQSMLNDAINNIHAEVLEYELDDLKTNEDLSIPADPNVRNFSFIIVDGKIYFRENSRMNPVEVPVTAENRIKGMLQIRDCVRTLIEYQIEDYSDDDIKSQQDKLNKLYNSFTKQYGLINSRANSLAFSDDSSYCLLCSLEVVDENGQLLKKADMFTKRTIKQHTAITCVDTSSEALAVSLGERAKVDMNYMCTLTGKTEKEIIEDLNGVIFLNPIYGYGDNTQEKYICGDEYLSGNVREKLFIARQSANLYPNDYAVNVQSLESVQPDDLTASEISVRLGATWIPPEIIRQFIFELFSTPRYMQWNIKVHYSNFTCEWNIEGKSHDKGNIKAYNTYGTSRIDGYKIIEETLNLKDVRIYDYVEDSDGKKQQILNKKETTLAQGKQELIKTAFSEWIWSNSDRREKLCKIYNEKFNSQRPREYDGSHITFSGINPEIILRSHQVNAIAHIMYGGNTLLAHVVGAGKSATRS